MARRTTKVPDAWEDDDWEVQADKAAAAPEEDSTAAPQVALSKAERLAKHAESNRRLWESAEAPAQTFHFLPTTSTSTSTPTPNPTTDFKPAVKVLSRKPVIQKRDPATGQQSRLEDLDSDDEDARNAAARLSPAEVRARQLREREEKQRRYDEARAKIFGTANTNTTGGTGAGGGGAGVGASNPSSGTSTPTPTPGAVTPPRSADGRGHHPRGRGRGGRGGNAHAHTRHSNESRGGGGGGESGGSNTSNSQQQQQQRPGSQSGGGGVSVRELYDPNYSPKPGFQLERRGNNNSHSGNGIGNNDNGGAPLHRRSTPREEDQVIRAPRGPDGSGRGGFGFARRGANNKGSA